MIQTVRQDKNVLIYNMLKPQESNLIKIYGQFVPETIRFLVDVMQMNLDIEE
jgi:hypothetical protein